MIAPIARPECEDWSISMRLKVFLLLTTQECSCCTPADENSVVVVVVAEGASPVLCPSRRAGWHIEGGSYSLLEPSGSVMLIKMIHSGPRKDPLFRWGEEDLRDGVEGEY